MDPRQFLSSANEVSTGPTLPVNFCMSVCIYSVLGQAVGGAGGWLATTLVATILIIFFLLLHHFSVAPFSHRRSAPIKKPIKGTLSPNKNYMKYITSLNIIHKVKISTLTPFTVKWLISLHNESEKWLVSLCNRFEKWLVSLRNKATLGKIIVTETD